MRTNWVGFCLTMGTVFVLAFGGLMLTEEVPWREQDRAVVQGKWLMIDIPRTKGQPNLGVYEYVANGRLHRGEFRCSGCLSHLQETPSQTPMAVEYRLANAKVSRPLIEGGGVQYRRIAFKVGIAMLVAGLLGVVLTKPTVR